MSYIKRLNRAFLNAPILPITANTKYVFSVIVTEEAAIITITLKKMRLHTLPPCNTITNMVSAI